MNTFVTTFTQIQQYLLIFIAELSKRLEEKSLVSDLVACFVKKDDF